MRQEFHMFFLENQVHSAMRVLGPFWLYEEFDDRYPKKPTSVTKKDISDYHY